MVCFLKGKERMEGPKDGVLTWTTGWITGSHQFRSHAKKHYRLKSFYDKVGCSWSPKCRENRWNWICSMNWDSTDCASDWLLWQFCRT
jgi:hypothetical protein